MRSLGIFPKFSLIPANIVPEGLLFLAAKESPSGKPLLIVSNEASATITIFEIQETAPSPEA